MKIIRFEEIPSTQDYLKKNSFFENAVVIAERQTGGKGTKGRSFSSEKGGVYLSALFLRPCKAKDGFSVMISSAMAVVNTLAAFGIEANIKWPNDVFVNGKKICGILIENEISGKYIGKSYIGIGLNINNPLPEELLSSATSAKEVLQRELPLETVAATLIYNLFHGKYSIDEYRKKSLVLERRITVIRGERKTEEIAKGIADNGNLILESGEELSAAEVSLKL